MRLIDADKIVEDDHQHYEYMSDTFYVTVADIEDAPTIDAVPVVRCKDCKHYEVDPFITMSGVPIIPAHHVCTFWAGGCMTNPEGYCFAGEKKEDET